MHIEVFRVSDGWSWRKTNDAGEVIATATESYTTPGKAKLAASAS